MRRLATGETVEFELQHLHKHVKLFGLLAGYKVQDIQAEDPVNIKAAERMAFLFELYQRITSLLPAAAVKKVRKIKAENFNKYDPIGQ